MEVWKGIPDRKGYEVSSIGRVRNRANGKILKQKTIPGGYKKIMIKRRSFSVHRLVALAFIANPRNCPTVNHKDRVRDNNDVGNLEWATYQEQALERDNSRGHARGVWQCDKETSRPINFYTTIAAALLALGKNTAVNYLAKAAKTNGCVYGFKWMYAGEAETLPGEIWKEFKKSGLDKGVFVSNLGRIRSGTRLLKTHSDNNGYLVTSDNRAVHILVATLFVANPHDYKVVNHLDGNKLNPSASNLEWTTQSGNAVHAIESGLRCNVTNVAHIDEHGVVISTFKSCSHAGRALNVNVRSVNKCCKGTLLSCGENKLRFAYYDPIANVATPAVRASQQPVSITGRKIRKIGVYDSEGNPLGTYDSIQACCAALSVNEKTVSAHCNGKVKHPRGSLRFRYQT